MMNIRINNRSIHTNDNSRIIRVIYKQPLNARYHPFDTRAEESHYISEQGFSYLGNIDNITRKSCIENIEGELKFNRYVRFIYQRLIMIHNGVVIWDNKAETYKEKNCFKGFVLHALYGEFIAEEHKCGYNITNKGVCADEVYIWESCDYALGRALNFSKKYPYNYCLVSGISFDYNELIKGNPVPPWAVSELRKDIMKSLIDEGETSVTYNTENFFSYFNTLTRAEKEKFIEKYPEPPQWRNWYASEGAHRITDITDNYKQYLDGIEEKKLKMKSVMFSMYNRIMNRSNDDEEFDESEYSDARNLFFKYNGSLADMCANGDMEKYVEYNVPKALEKKWNSELVEIWLENISDANECFKFSNEIINMIHRDDDYLLMKKFAMAFEDSYFLIDSYEFLTICQIMLDKITYEKYGKKEEFIFLLDEFENFIAEMIERKNIKCSREDISETEIRRGFAVLLRKIMKWQTSD